MATRSKSSSGAYMSQYDTEVEKRLKALEAHTHESTGDTVSAGELFQLKNALFEARKDLNEINKFEEKLEFLRSKLSDISGRNIKWD